MFGLIALTVMRNKFSIVAILALGGTACQQTVHLESTRILKRISDGRDLDLLIVMDNSSSTSDKQTLFAKNLTAFSAALDAFPGGRPNLHIGVVTTSVDIGVPNLDQAGCPSPDPVYDGRLQNVPFTSSCTGPTDRYISDIMQPDGTRLTNYGGTLADTLGCIGQLGEHGCGFESPLEAMKRALNGQNPENAGFLRPAANLAVVILTDEDDCSIADPSFLIDAVPEVTTDFICQPLASYDCDEPISPDQPGSYTDCRPAANGPLATTTSYADFLATIKDPSQTVVSIIAGDPAPDIATGPLTTSADTQNLALLPSCSVTLNGQLSIGRPGIRLAALAQSLGDHGQFQTVCQTDYSAALTAIGATTMNMMASCLGGDVAIDDIDASAPGLQLGCTVTQRAGFGTNGEIDTVMPACDMLNDTTPAPAGARPCYWLQNDPNACAAQNGNIAIQFARSTPAPDDTVIDADCELAQE